ARFVEFLEVLISDVIGNNGSVMPRRPTLRFKRPRQLECALSILLRIADEDVGHGQLSKQTRSATLAGCGKRRGASAIWYQSSWSRHSATNSSKVSGPSSASASLAATSSFPDRTPSWLVSALRKIARHCSIALGC